MARVEHPLQSGRGVLYLGCTRSQVALGNRGSAGGAGAPSHAEFSFCGGSISKSIASYGRVHTSGPCGRVHPKLRRHRACGGVRARALPARGGGRRGGARVRQRRAGGRSTPRWRSCRSASATPRPRGGGSSRCCWAWKECSPTRSRGCATAPCSPPTRWTPSRAPSPRCWRRPSAPQRQWQRPCRGSRLAGAAGLGGDPRQREGAPPMAAPHSPGAAGGGRRWAGGGGRGGG